MTNEQIIKELKNDIEELEEEIKQKKREIIKLLKKG